MKKNHIMKVMGDVSPKISANTLYCFPGENICSFSHFIPSITIYHLGGIGRVVLCF